MQNIIDNKNQQQHWRQRQLQQLFQHMFMFLFALFDFSPIYLSTLAPTPAFTYFIYTDLSEAVYIQQFQNPSTFPLLM